MIRLLAIPVAGTVAALIVVLLAHAPRQEQPEPFPEPPAALPEDVPEAPTPDHTKPEEKPPAEKPAPPRAEYDLRVEKDGSLVDLATGTTYANGAEVITALAHEKTRHRIILSNGEGVEEAALDRLHEILSAKFDVRKVYRAAEEKEK